LSNSSAKDTNTAFTNIDKHAFCYQLAMRVRYPKIIDQSQTKLCGPVAPRV